jgi:DNA-binding NarL/FixJ family response regulator
MRCNQAPRGLQAVDPGHAHVDEDEVRVDLVREAECLLATGRLAERPEACGRLDYLACDAAEDRLVVDGDDPDGAGEVIVALRIHEVRRRVLPADSRAEPSPPADPPARTQASVSRWCTHDRRGARASYRAAVGIRVALADDSLLVREGLEQLLTSEDTVEVVASCADLPSLLEAIESERPDVVLTDIRMPPSKTDEGIQVAARLRERHPDVGVLVLSQYSEPSYALALLEAGSEGRGYLLKERVHDRAQLVAALAAVAEGGSVIDPAVVDVLVSAQAGVDRSPLAELTAREREVLAEIAQGKSNGAIAESLVLTKRAVEKHINSIFLKLNLSEAEDVSKRVKATLTYLAAEEDASKHPR